MPRPTYDEIYELRGVDFLMKHRPWWTYLPGLHRAFVRGFVLGCEFTVSEIEGAMER